MALPTADRPLTPAYFAASAALADERHRLDLLQRRYDPTTIERLSAIDIAPGWRALEAGAGGGSIATWLAERVGAHGLVVATDIDTRFLGHLGSNHPGSNIEVRRHDIVRDPIEPAAYDLVHCRSLLMHVADPAAALANLLRSVRPGGWVVAENNDYSALLAVHGEDPAGAEWNRAAAVVLGLASGQGLWVHDYGRRLPGVVARAGFEVVSQEGRTTVRHGGDFVAEMLRQSFSYLAGLPACVGVRAELATFLAGFADPDFEFVDAINFAVTARRPPREN